MFQRGMSYLVSMWVYSIANENQYQSQLRYILDLRLFLMLR
jgi:hypothetical protein